MALVGQADPLEEEEDGGVVLIFYDIHESKLKQLLLDVEPSF